MSTDIQPYIAYLSALLHEAAFWNDEDDSRKKEDLLAVSQHVYDLWKNTPGDVSNLFPEAIIAWFAYLADNEDLQDDPTALDLSFFRSNGFQRLIGDEDEEVSPNTAVENARNGHNRAQVVITSVQRPPSTKRPRSATDSDQNPQRKKVKDMEVQEEEETKKGKEKATGSASMEEGVVVGDSEEEEGEPPKKKAAARATEKAEPKKKAAKRKIGDVVGGMEMVVKGPGKAEPKKKPAKGRGRAVADISNDESQPAAEKATKIGKGKGNEGNHGTDDGKTSSTAKLKAKESAVTKAKNEKAKAKTVAEVGEEVPVEKAGATKKKSAKQMAESTSKETLSHANENTSEDDQPLPLGRPNPRPLYKQLKSVDDADPAPQKLEWEPASSSCTRCTKEKLQCLTRKDGDKCYWCEKNKTARCTFRSTNRNESKGGEGDKEEGQQQKETANSKANTKLKVNGSAKQRQKQKEKEDTQLVSVRPSTSPPSPPPPAPVSKPVRTPALKKKQESSKPDGEGKPGKTVTFEVAKGRKPQSSSNPGLGIPDPCQQPLERNSQADAIHSTSSNGPPASSSVAPGSTSDRTNYSMRSEISDLSSRVFRSEGTMNELRAFNTVLLQSARQREEDAQRIANLEDQLRHALQQVESVRQDLTAAQEATAHQSGLLSDYHASLTILTDSLRISAAASSSSTAGSTPAPPNSISTPSESAATAASSTVAPSSSRTSYTRTTVNPAELAPATSNGVGSSQTADVEDNVDWSIMHYFNDLNPALQSLWHTHTPQQIHDYSMQYLEQGVGSSHSQSIPATRHDGEVRQSGRSPGGTWRELPRRSGNDTDAGNTSSDSLAWAPSRGGKTGRPAGMGTQPGSLFQSTPRQTADSNTRLGIPPITQMGGNLRRNNHVQAQPIGTASSPRLYRSTGATPTGSGGDISGQFPGAFGGYHESHFYGGSEARGASSREDSMSGLNEGEEEDPSQTSGNSFYILGPSHAHNISALRYIHPTVIPTLG
ncbi:hypothetical protein BKA70DRAFT_1451508 [Coprinopsis sp. MPI-PUGE-AT-0042]|nr:hypothetical protein BKA70DRAFT_1451508 [Coprinopsis sp. MPI-PUGE-AT-0042]